MKTLLRALPVVAVLCAVVVGQGAPAYAGIASIPSLVIQPDPAVDATQSITLQMPGDDITFETPSALGKLVSNVHLRLSDGSTPNCMETTADQVWSCGNVHDALIGMVVSYHTNSLLGNADATYTVKVGLTVNLITSASYGQRVYASGQVTVKAGYEPTSDVRVTAFRVTMAAASGPSGTQSDYEATVANDGPQRTRLTLTISGLGSTRLLNSDPTCTQSTNYTCIWTLDSGKTVTYGLTLHGSASSLHLTLTATVKGDNYDPSTGNNTRTLVLPQGNTSGLSSSLGPTSGSGAKTSGNKGSIAGASPTPDAAVASTAPTPSEALAETPTPGGDATGPDPGQPRAVASASPTGGHAGAWLTGVGIALLVAAGTVIRRRRRRTLTASE